MKRIVTVCFMILSALLMIIIPFVPHHHHEDAICMVVDHSGYEQEDDASCAANIFVFNAKQTSSKITKSDQWLAPILFLLEQYILNIDTGSDLPQNVQPSFYHSPQTKGVGVLRGPPAIVC